MDDLLPEPLPGRFALVVAPHSAIRLLLERAALLALRGPLRVLDGGNCFNVYVVAQALRRRSPQVQEALGRILLSRAFTCYQVLALLEDSTGASVLGVRIASMPSALHVTGPGTAPLPLLFLDLLATFRDENVRMEERRRLLQAVIAHLRRLANEVPVLVSVTLAGGGAAGAAALHDDLLTLLEDAADPVWRFNPPPPQLPMRLF